ncbi:MAG: helix-turn-helix domain-containing protein [Kordiimonadaceae bacterium]|nr:helix-turn-helix domain-containing protein [Kordiimonadaceae bacterium]
MTEKKLEISLGERIKQVRKSTIDPRTGRHMSQGRLGELIGMSHTAIRKIEQGGIQRPTKLYEIAKELRVTEEFLLGHEPLTATDKAAPVKRIIVDSFVKAGEWLPEHRIAQDNYYPAYWSFREDMPEKLFGVEVQDDSMSDKYPRGSMVFVEAIEARTTTMRLPRLGDLLLIEMENAEGLKQRALKELVRADDGFKLISRTSTLGPGSTPLIYQPQASIDIGICMEAGQQYSGRILGVVVAGARSDMTAG